VVEAEGGRGVIDLRCCGVADVLAETRGAALVHADPPWSYDNEGCQGTAADSYDTITMSEIVAHIDSAFDSAERDSYLLLWCTFPKLVEWLDASSGMRWTYKSGGAWAKSDGFGVGFHWRGDSEILLLYTKGKPRPLNRLLSNLHIGPRTKHSEKPEPWLRALVAGFCPADGLVLDLYAGLAPMARACKATGRDYLGAEIDEERHRHAMAKLNGTAYHKNPKQTGLFP